MATTGRLPVAWDDWRVAWIDWRDRQLAAGALQRTGYRFPAKNLLADEVLGVWRIGHRNVELSEVTFPDLDAPRFSGQRVRYIGVTYGTGAGTKVPQPLGIAGSFAELEEILSRDCGVSFAVADGETDS